jgi:hypothetical protein
MARPMVGREMRERSILQCLRNSVARRKKLRNDRLVRQMPPGGIPEERDSSPTPDSMPKTPSERRRDPMEREVDRLLAQLARTGSPPARAEEPRVAPILTPVTPRRAPSVDLSAVAISRGALIALWTRVLLGTVLGVLMTQWPYPHGCGLPLLGYLGAVTAVLLAAAWIAFASWRLRRGVAHVVGFILFFWGIVLAAEQLLPRIGYAALEASWQCPSEPV